MRYSPPNWVFVAVDGTLCESVIAWCRAKRQQGTKFVLWSMRGRDHAMSMAERKGCLDLFEAILAKPGRIIDDNGWSWIRYTAAKHPEEFAKGQLE